ncbi:MAG TPA: tRNA (adenosine(37)-N6)-threonylcarbamoyltransferase complex dimerization subunit type 1 TsaB [Gammaproteobacteria bacterium]|nr:tRNA (adenosine(37)-N6)-threonylcarbamoyltransferase complex dimerization subunit type 1 TsaB [Gammaproteobacteria bacterium]
MNDSTLLAIESSTSQCSIAIYAHGRMHEKSFNQPRKHLEMMYSAFDDLLIEAGISKGSFDGVLVGQGPGQFTGLRVALGFAQGLAYSLKIPLFAVSSLAIIVKAQLRNVSFSQANIAMNARQNYVYYGVYDVKKSVVTAAQKDICLTVDQWLCIPRDSMTSFIDSTFDWGESWVKESGSDRFFYEKPLASDLIQYVLDAEIANDQWKKPTDVYLNYLRHDVAN